MKKTTISTLQTLKKNNDKITMLTAYDALSAYWISQANVEIVLVGDSLGMVIQGHESTIPVTLEHMRYHVQCVAKGLEGPLLLADLPFMAAASLARTLEGATALMQAGANMVKIEGGAWLSESVETLVRNGIPVCAHLGLTPQSINQLGGYKVQGKTATEASLLEDSAKALVDSGISLLVLECVPAALAAQIREKIPIPVIGIGAGREVDGQVLVMQDLLGLTPKLPRFAKNFLAQAPDIPTAFKHYVQAVKQGDFPTAEHAF